MALLAAACFLHNRGMTHQLFDVAACTALLGADAHDFDLVALRECDSTNTQLMQLAEAGARSGTVVVADRQTAGRGRRARHWVSAPDDSLTFSLLWRFASSSRAPEALSLAVGLALRRAVVELGAVVDVKWPNDLLHRGRKLAGVLIDMQPGDIKSAVIGVGINLRLPSGLPADVAATATSLDAISSAVPTCEALLAAALTQLALVLRRYECEGFIALLDEWQAAHAFHNQEVRVAGDVQDIVGICRGVGAGGELLVETATGLQRVLAGDVSLRPA